MAFQHGMWLSQHSDEEGGNATEARDGRTVASSMGLAITEQPARRLHARGNMSFQTREFTCKLSVSVIIHH